MCNKKLKETSIICLAAVLFFGLILSVYGLAGSTSIFEHSPYDSYTLQAMAWRKGKTCLDQNYEYLELAVVNDGYFATHDKDDYLSYREFFGGINVPIKDQAGNEYYVSFPPFPSVPMFFLTFIFGENTPSGLVSVLYIVGSFVFAILLSRRIGLNLAESICLGVFSTVASSAFFLATNYIVGGVWFMAQSLALFLTMASFYFVNGNKKWEHYLAFLLLAFAVGCRPFQIVYFLYLAYVVHKKYDFKFFKTLKYYIAPFLVGCAYAWYNYIRFGDILEFGHNYLPEFMRVPDGQFSFSYITGNLKYILAEFPYFENGTLEFYHGGFAFYVANVIFTALAVAIIMRAITKFIGTRKREISFKAYVSNTTTVECVILFVLLILHFMGIVMHKTLGAWQFGSRYTVDMIPAAVVMFGLIVKSLKDETNALEQGFHKQVNRVSLITIYSVSIIVLLDGSVLNVVGSYLLFP